MSLSRAQYIEYTPQLLAGDGTNAVSEKFLFHAFFAVNEERNYVQRLLLVKAIERIQVKSVLNGTIELARQPEPMRNPPIGLSHLLALRLNANEHVSEILAIGLERAISQRAIRMVLTIVAIAHERGLGWVNRLDGLVSQNSVNAVTIDMRVKELLKRRVSSAQAFLQIHTNLHVVFSIYTMNIRQCKRVICP
jgi:hypothetical protein